MQHLLFSGENESKLKCTPAGVEKMLWPHPGQSGIGCCCCAMEQAGNALTRSIRLLSLVLFTIIVN